MIDTQELLNNTSSVQEVKKSFDSLTLKVGDKVVVVRNYSGDISKEIAVVSKITPTGYIDVGRIRYKRDGNMQQKSTIGMSFHLEYYSEKTEKAIAKAQVRFKIINRIKNVKFADTFRNGKHDVEMMQIYEILFGKDDIYNAFSILASDGYEQNNSK